MPRDTKKRKRDAPTVERIPRPANCFLIFRADWLRNSTASSAPGSHNHRRQKDVSLEAAAAWKNLSPILKQLYRIQADIIKDEHSKEHPGWVYQPRNGKGKSRVADDATQDGPPTKRVARRRPTVPSVKQEATATPFNQATAPTKSIWEGSWFSGSSSMRDPFYSTPLQPLASVSTLESPVYEAVAHLADKSTTALPPMITPHPRFFLSPAQMHGSGMVPNFPTMPSMYCPTQGFMNGQPRNPELHGYNALIRASSALGPSDFYQLPRATTLAQPLVNPGPRVILPNLTRDSTPTAGSSAGEASTPESEAEPPTQALAGLDSEFTYYNRSESDYKDHKWEVSSAFDPDFNPSSMMGH